MKLIENEQGRDALVGRLLSKNLVVPRQKVASRQISPRLLNTIHFSFQSNLYCCTIRAEHYSRFNHINRGSEHMIEAIRAKLIPRDLDPLAASMFVVAGRGSSLIAAPSAVPSLLKTSSLPLLASSPPRHQVNITLELWGNGKIVSSLDLQGAGT